MSTAKPNPIDVNAGKRVRQRRLLLGLSQTALGKSAAPPVTFQQIQKYEKGMNRISASRLAQFADILRVPPGYFFEGAMVDAIEPEANYIDVFLGTRAGVALAKAFVEIKDRKTQQSIVALVEQIARRP